MPKPFHLRDQQLVQFADEGLLRLEGLLEGGCVVSARRAVLAPLEQLGIWRDGDWRLDERRKPIWPDAGLKPARDIGHRRPEVEALIAQPALRAVVECLLNRNTFDEKVYPRPQVLASLPNCDRWFIPTGWHTDLPRLASGRRPGVQLFTFLDRVEPQGGGTVVVAGSHRLLNDGRNLKVSEITAALRGEPFFQQLLGLTCEPAPDALPSGRVEGVPLKVVELVGQPGDVWLMDLRVLHAVAPNASRRPRLMVTYRFVPTDVMPEVAAAFGWT